MISRIILAITAMAGLAHAEAPGIRVPYTLKQSTASGTSNTFNPDISINGLFLGLQTSQPLALEPAFGHEAEEDHEIEDHADDEHSDEHGHGLPETGGISVQEIEIRFTANVDAYVRADLILAMPGTEGIELEEGFVESIGLPNVSLRAGKFLSAFGKHNALHTHAYPFIDAPVTQERLLGGEGLNEVGVRASFLLPFPWFSELNLELLDGENEIFSSEGSEDFAYVGNLKSLWDLSDESTLELGGSLAAGKNASGKQSRIAGSDLTLKWQSTGQVKRNLSIRGEYLHGRIDDGVDIETAGGLNLSVQLQTSRAWWVQGRYDVFGIPSTDGHRQHRLTGLLALVPSEFSAFRLQYNLNKEQGETVHQVALQVNFTMGAHPAHAY